jgi:hypothetical protein
MVSPQSRGHPSGHVHCRADSMFWHRRSGAALSFRQNTEAGATMRNNSRATLYQRAAGVILMLPLAGGSTAQAPVSGQPNATDLHAAYCTQVLKFLIDGAESSATLFSGPEYSTVPGPNDPPALLASKAKAAAANRDMKASLESQKAMLRKIDLYLKPRFFDLDPIPLVAAQRAAQEDWNRIGAATGACQSECPITLEADALTVCMNACTARAMPDLPTIQRKTKSCLNLDWLPF